MRTPATCMDDTRFTTVRFADLLVHDTILFIVQPLSLHACL